MSFRFLVICLLVPACSYWYAPKVLKGAAGAVYEVKKGDTVHSIAQSKRISALDLMEVNGITDSSAIRVGQRLYIPETEPRRNQTVAKATKTAAKQAVPVNPAIVRPVEGKTINLIWPVKNAVVFKTFDTRPQTLYEGIALGAPLGTPVFSAAPGEVIYVGDDEARYGKIVIIHHEDPFVTIYAHLNQIEVKKGQKVKQGETIGTLGKTGQVDSPRVYFQVRNNRTPVDPEHYLKN